ncbi:MAG: sigma-70 family RNA polymerase sigma factor [Actinobacteria bacterium]|nr:sigma-70 family RNA polymerase sigma factor [Actinomycetota bacterium]
MGDDAETRIDLDDIWREHRTYLVDLAFRMLGRVHDAEDVVQEAFARLLRADVAQIHEIRGWLVVVVSRLCLDQLRSARSRREMQVDAVDERSSRPGAPPAGDPADRVTLDDSVSMALLVVLEQLTPAERAVFVLREVFQFSFEAVAEIVGRTPSACRQLATRARRRLESETAPARFRPGAGEHHRVAEEFIAACAGGDLQSLTRLLDPEVVGDVDLGPGGPKPRPLHGSHVIARNLLGFFGPQTGLTLVSQPVNGQTGALAFHDGELAAILVFKLRDDLIYDIHAVADPRKLAFVTHGLR